MRLLNYLIALFTCVILEGTQGRDEPLSKQPWSQFGPLCKHYVAGRKEKPDAAYAILKSHVDPNTATILDLGSGTGISTRQLYKNGFKHVIGVDRDPLMIKEAQAANTPARMIKYIQADVSMGLPFPDEQFDVVTAASAFHWFSNPSSIQEVERILKTQGYYFVIGGKTRYQQGKKINPLRENIERILEEFGIKRSKKDHIPVADALEEQGFKIIVDATIPYITYYTKQEFLDRIQSQSSWNLVKDSQRQLALKKIDQYLDTIVDQQGRIKKEGSVNVVLAQKEVKE